MRISQLCLMAQSKLRIDAKAGGGPRQSTWGWVAGCAVG